MERAWPLGAALVTAIASFLAFKAPGAMTWAWLVSANLALGAAALVWLRREEILVETIKLEPGDISRGIGAAALGVGIALAAGEVGMRVATHRTGEEVLQLLRIRQAVTPEVKRAGLVIAAAFAEEIVWRGAVTQALAVRFGSTRAPWIASAIGVAAVVPTMRPGVILGAVVVGALSAGLVQRFRGRIAPAMVAHAALTWVVTEIVLLHLWQKVRMVYGL